MYAVICIDKPGAEDVRKANRAAHLAYIESTGVVAMAGPFLSDGGELMTGSLLILDVEARSQAEAWAENDPYARAGLFDSVEVRRFKKVVG